MKILNKNFNNDLMDKKNDSVDNIRLNNFAKQEIFTNKSESPESFRHNNNYFPNFNLINNNYNHSNSIIYNNNFNLSHINDNENIHMNKNINIHPQNMNNINIINNNNNFFNNMNNFNNFNKINDINLNLNNSFHNSNQNLNLSYNFSPNVNNSFEDLNIIPKKRGDSFNSCPSLKGNHLSFKSTDDSNNNKQNKNIGNYVNTNLNNFSINPKPFNNINNNYSTQYQNYLSMQHLIFNLNPHTASLMRNNNFNRPQHNSAKNLYRFNNTSNFNNKPMSLFNKNLNPIHKNLHYNFSSYNINDINNINKSFDAKIYNDNLSNNSNVGSSHSIKKKRTSLFQNESNKEKDLRDFKRFCDGLKMPMCEYICNQIGSRIMQKYLKRFPSHIRTLLINKISSYMDKLMCNTYGNYFCQKLYNISDLQQRLSILNNLKKSFLSISKSNSGAHAIQFIIGVMQSPQEKKIILDYIMPHILDLSYDTEGTHVIQKILSCFDEKERKGLDNIFSDKKNLSSLCQDAKGICVIKKYILGTKDINTKNKIVEGIYDNCVEIALSPYGNYIIQIIFEEWDIDICHKLIDTCIANSFILSCQKYSSNIIVKIIDLFANNEKEENKYFWQKLKDVFFDEKNLSELYNNKYGRLLLNKIIKFIKEEEKDILLKKFKEQKNNIDILNELFC